MKTSSKGALNCRLGGRTAIGKGQIGSTEKTTRDLEGSDRLNRGREGSDKLNRGREGDK